MTPAPRLSNARPPDPVGGVTRGYQLYLRWRRHVMTHGTIVQWWEELPPPHRAGWERLATEIDSSRKTTHA